MQRVIQLESRPERIVSLVPSQTELLHHLGLEQEVVGITKFCIHPEEWYREKTRIGGTKKVDFSKVQSLQPDLIIGNKEENERSDIEMLEHKYPVWMSDIFDLDDSLHMIASIGQLTGKENEAQKLISEIQTNFDRLDEWVEVNIRKPLSVAYLIWNNPAYCAGTHTFIDAMLNRCGLVNYMQEARYPELQQDNASQPDLIFLSSEPFPFKEKHVQDYQSKFPDAKVVLVDGEMFSWYGARLLKAPDYFRRLLENLASD